MLRPSFDVDGLGVVHQAASVAATDVGTAQLEDAYLDPDNCIGDSIDGFATRLIIARGN